MAARLHQAGLRGFEARAVSQHWTFFTTTNASATPKLAGPTIPELTEELSAHPDNPFFLTPLFSLPDQPHVSAVFPVPEIHVAFEPDVPLSVVELELRKAGAGEILQIDWIGEKGLYRVAMRSKSGAQALRVANRLAEEHPEVRYAEPRLINLVKMSGGCEPLDLPNNNEPNDPLFSESWGLEQNWGTDPMAFDLNALGAWKICGGDSDVVTAAVFDDGFDYLHPDLQANIFDGADTTEDCGAPDGICQGLIFSAPRGDCNNHGTTVLSILGAVGGNGIGTLGIAARVRILAVRVVKYMEPDENNPECQAMIDPNAGGRSHRRRRLYRWHR